MIAPDVLALAKKLGVNHIQDVNHDGKIDVSDVKATKALMDKAQEGKGK